MEKNGPSGKSIKYQYTQGEYPRFTTYSCCRQTSPQPQHMGVWAKAVNQIHIFMVNDFTSTHRQAEASRDNDSTTLTGGLDRVGNSTSH